jgi:predicted O-linked N-acetylglucosamine transferase (SPINDLY family)
MRDRLEAAFDHWIDVQSISDLEITKLSRELEIDIAIDLGGYTSKCRTEIFNNRVAPIQVSYIGFLGTMSNNKIDYLIADRTIITNEEKDAYTEKIIFLPSYQINDRKRKIADKKFTREELGLPRNSFIFCNFNNNYKLTPDIFNGWIEILKRTTDSSLFLYAENNVVVKNLKNYALARNVDSNRLIFGNKISAENYLARYQICDLFLDTFPYNGGTTCSDAIWAGLPVVTLKGKSFASRYASSILNSAGQSMLIANSLCEYINLAINLAENPSKLKIIKKELENNRLTMPLFNSQLFTKNIEKAYIKMYERNQQNLPPDHITID